MTQIGFGGSFEFKLRRKLAPQLSSAQLSGFGAPFVRAGQMYCVSLVH